MDELNFYLRNKYAEYITGRKDCNMLIWGIVNNAINVPKLCTLIVGVEYDPKNTEENKLADLLNERYTRDSHFKKMYRFGNNIASKGSIPYIVLGYPSFRKNYENQWELSLSQYPLDKVYFFLHEFPLKERKILTGYDLKKYIYRKLEIDDLDYGTSKSVNKSIADYFQFWSRNYLTKNLIKFDIDGLFMGKSNGAVVEIKRSNIPPIPYWKPHIKDYPDYALLKSFADSINMKLLILHHTGKSECKSDSIISFFDVEEFIGLSEGMKYSKIDLKMKLEGENSLEDYLFRYIIK